MAKYGRFRDLLPWDRLVAHGTGATVTQTKGGTLLATLTYSGTDTGMMGEPERASYYARLNALLMRLGTGWALWMDEWYEPTTAYPESPWTNPTACFVDASRRSTFAEGVLYASTHFATLGYTPPSQARGWKAQGFEWFFHDGLAPRATMDVPGFTQRCTQWADLLHGLCPAWHWLSPSETLTYYHRCVSWAREPVGVPEVPIELAARLATTDFIPGYLPKLGDQLLCPVEIQCWPPGDAQTGGGMGETVPTALHGLAYAYRFTVRYLPLDVQDAEAVLRTTARKWAGVTLPQWPAWLAFLAPGDADLHAASTTDALAQLHAGATQYGYTAPVVTVWDPTPEGIARKAREVARVLRGAGLVVADSPMNSCQAWLGTLPGDTLHNIRQPLLPSAAVATLMPNSTMWAGEPTDTHYGGPPLLTTSSDGMPFRLALHPQGSELGNVMVLGPSRSGKSGFLGFCASQFQRYPGAQTFCFDKDYALYGTTVLHGGTHLDFDGSLPIAPLAMPDDHMQWSLGWVTAVLRGELGRALTPDEQQEAWLALERLTRLPLPERTLTTYAQFLQDRPLKQALTPYLQGGPYGFCDSSRRAAALTDWTTVEMSHLLAMPQVLPHVLRYLFHQIEQCLTGAPTLIILDEAWRLLHDDVFRAEMLHWLKERAKKNVSVLVSTQEVHDAASSGAWQAIQGSCQAWVYLANPAALKPDVAAFYRTCGLTEEMIHLLSVSTPRQDYLYVSPQGARRFQVLLTPLERALVAPSRLEEIARLRHLVSLGATDPSLVATWLAETCPEVAPIYQQSYERHDDASL